MAPACAGATAPATRIVATAEVDALLADDDALARRTIPATAGGRQPVHTVYVPADRFTPHDLVARWGAAALAALDEHARSTRALAAATAPRRDVVAAGLPARVAKLASEPVEDLRIDLEDGYGTPAATPRRTRRVDAAVRHWWRRLDGPARAAVLRDPFQVVEAPTRRRGLRTLDLFVGGVSLGGRAARRGSW